MHIRKEKFFIINRSFWPVYPVIGEALLRLAEKKAEEMEVGIIFQSRVDIKNKLKENDRGKGVNFFPVKALSVSGSSIILRSIDAVFFMGWVLIVLIWQKPKKVYVSTDPPVLVPFVVMLYCALFDAKYVYHLQDIHPEATNVVVPIRPCLFKFFKSIDAKTMRNASLLLTITEEMAKEISMRSNTKASINVIPNPSVSFEDITIKSKLPGFTFCGNAGRLQRIPLLIEAISEYARLGGTLPFVFAGAGVYADHLAQKAAEYPIIIYKGFINPTQAAELNASYEWALLPIEDEVTRYAFPSKTSSYVYSGALIAAICGKQTSVATWVNNYNLGLVVEPKVEALVQFFFDAEKGKFNKNSFDTDRLALKASLNFDVFVEKLDSFISIL